MTKTRLTDLSIRRLPHPDKGQARYWDETTPGFGLSVSQRSKSFVVVYGKDRRLKVLGRYPSMSLSDARAEAKRVQSFVPSMRRSWRLVDAVANYLDDCELRVRPNTLKEYRRHLLKAPDVTLEELTNRDVDLSEPHAINAWKVFMNWCVRNELADRNPFAHLPVRYGKRERVLSDPEIKAIWQYEHKPFSDVVKLLLLTGQRRNQIWKLQPEWISDTIEFPAEIMKNGKPHSLPYGPLAKHYLSRAPFNFNGWSKAKVRMDKRTGVSGWTLHDLRRTHATIQMRLGTPVHVTEAILAHCSGTISGVAAIYIRHSFHEEMRAAMLRFEEHLSETVERRATHSELSSETADERVCR